MEFIAELKRELDELKDDAEKQELRVRYHETRAYYIAMAYIIWERFLISFDTSNYCSHRWMLFGFNLSCSLFYILFFLEAVTMMYRSQNHLDIISRTLDEISQHIITLINVSNPDHARHHHHLESGDSVSRAGFDFSFRVPALDQYRPYTILQRKLYFASILCALLALTAFQLWITFNSSMCN